MGEIALGPMADSHLRRLRDIRDGPAFVTEIRRLPDLPDSDDPIWDTDEPWDSLAALLAASRMIGERGWKNEVRPIFERAALGDVFDRMQGIRHGLGDWCLLERDRRRYRGMLRRLRRR